MSGSRIYVAGYDGISGCATVRTLLAQGVPQNSIVTRTRAELAPCNRALARGFFATEQPTQVYLATAKTFISKVKELTNLLWGACRNTQFSLKFIWPLAVELNQRWLCR